MEAQRIALHRTLDYRNVAVGSLLKVCVREEEDYLDVDSQALSLGLRQGLRIVCWHLLYVEILMLLFLKGCYPGA